MMFSRISTPGLASALSANFCRRCVMSSATEETLQKNSLQYLQAFANPQEYWLSSDLPRDYIRRFTSVLEEMMTEDRIKKVENASKNRIASVVVLAEHLSLLTNIYALGRGMECLGYQSVGVIGEFGRPPRTGKDRGEMNNHIIGAGSSNWLSIREWDCVLDAARHCREQGFQVAALSLQDDAVDMDEVDFTIPTAILVGNEKFGVSRKGLSIADKRVIIPMRGFTESLNVSNASSIVLYRILQQRRAKFGADYQDLSPEAQEWLRLFFYCQHLGAGMAQARIKRAMRMESLSDTFDFEKMKIRPPA